MAENIREIVLDTLLTLEKGEEYSNRLIRAVLDKYDYLDSREKSFIKRVTEGTVERKIELDYYLNQVSSVPVKKMKPLIRCLLRMSTYQLLYMDAVPDSAVCNEAVNLAGKRGFRTLKGFVNGVLRQLSKQKNSLALPEETKEPLQYLSVKYSMPLWLVEKWQKDYGQEQTKALLQGLMEIHPVSLRLSLRLTEEERKKQVQLLQDSGVVLQESAYLPYVYTVAHTDNISQLPGFAEGKFTVQDISSVLAVEAAGIQADDFVMDVCAAPGGKSILAAEKAKSVLARDVSLEKTAYIEENAMRMKAENIQVQVFDGTVFDESYREKADVVLLDVPCSGLGVMGKKRDIKYHITPEGLQSLTQLQKQIVENCFQYVKPGGILLYSTCTIHIEENEEMVKYIARELPFEPVSLQEVLPPLLWKQKKETEAAAVKKLLNQEEQDACIQLFPGSMSGDGFFFAKFRKKSEK